MARGDTTIGVFSDIDPGPGRYVHSDSNWVGVTSSPGVPIPNRTIAYQAGDVVHWQSALWVALRDNDNVEPNNVNTDDWELIGNATSRFLLSGANEGDLTGSQALALPFGALVNTQDTFNYILIQSFGSEATSMTSANQYAVNILNLFQIPDAGNVVFTENTPTEITLPIEFELTIIDPNTNEEINFFSSGTNIRSLNLAQGSTVSINILNIRGTYTVQTTFEDIPRSGRTVPLSSASRGDTIFRVRSDALVSGTELRIAPQNPVIGFVGDTSNEFNIGLVDDGISERYLADGQVTPRKTSSQIATITDVNRRAFESREVQRIRVRGATANSGDVSTDETVTLRLPSTYNSGLTSPGSTAIDFGPALSISQGTPNSAIDNLLELPSPNTITTNINTVQNTAGTALFTSQGEPLLTLEGQTALPINTAWNNINAIVFNRINTVEAANVVLNSFNAITNADNRIVLVYCNDTNWAAYRIPVQDASTLNPGAVVIGNALALYGTGAPISQLGQLQSNPRIYVADDTSLPTQSRVIGNYEFTMDTNIGSIFNPTNFPLAPALNAEGRPTPVTGSFMPDTGARAALNAIGTELTRVYGTPDSMAPNTVQGITVRPVLSPVTGSSNFTMDIRTNHMNVTPAFTIRGFGYQIPGTGGMFDENFMERFGGDVAASIVTVIPPGGEYVHSFALPGTETRATFISRLISEVNDRRPTDQQLREETLSSAWVASNPTGTDDVLFTSLLNGVIPNIWQVIIDHDDSQVATRLSLEDVVIESRGGDQILGVTPESPRTIANTITTVPRYDVTEGQSNSFIINVDDTGTETVVNWEDFNFGLNRVAPADGHDILRTLTFNGVTYDIAASSVNPRAVAFFDNEDQDAVLPGYGAGDTNPDDDNYNLVYDITVRNVNTSAANLLSEHSLSFGPRGGSMTTLNQSAATSVMTQDPNTIIRRFNVTIPQQRPVRGTASDNIIYDINFIGMFPDAESPNELDSIDITTTLTFTDQRQPITVTPSRIAKSLFDSTRDTFTVNYPTATATGTVYDTTEGIFNVAIGSGNPTLITSQTSTYQPALVAADTNYTFSFPLNAEQGSSPPESSNGQRTTAPNVTTMVDIYTPYYFGQADPAQIALLTDAATETPAAIESHLTSSTKDLEDGDMFTVTGGQTDVGDQIYVAFASSIATPRLRTSNGFPLEGISVGTIVVDNAISGTTTLNVFRYGEYTQNETYTIIGGS